MDKAEQIFYRAQVEYLTPSSNFEAMRNATVSSAADLYGDAEVASVNQAWCAVGVPGCDDDPPPPGGNELENGVAVTGLGASTGSEAFYTLEIPEGATDLVVKTSGGSGDVDLYVRRGSQPTTSTYDCRGFNSGNSETCDFDSPGSGTWHVMIRAYATYSGVTLLATWQDEDDPPPPGGDDVLTNGVPKTGLSGATGSSTFFTMVVPAGATNLSFQISGGTGDADLYVRFGAAPTTSNYDCRPYKNGNSETCSFDSPQAGTYHVMVRGYRTFSGLSLVGSFDDDGGPPPSCDPGGGSESGLSDSRGGQRFFTIDVPACATSLEVTISGGSGDADLYVRFGAAPTESSWDCRPWDVGNSEVCRFEPPQEGTYHIMIDAYASYSGVTLEAAFE